MHRHTLRVRLSLVVVALSAMTFASAALVAQTPAPKPAPKPATQPRAGTQKPAAPRTAAPPPAKPAAPAAPVAAPAPPPAPPAPQDVRFKTSYTTGDQKTETVTFVKGARERFEFQDMVLLKQHDEKRTIQISRAANTYLVTPEDAPPAPAAAGTPAKAPGVVMVTTTIVDTGERKAIFGQQARHVKTMIDKQPMPGACDATKQRIETDGWYIDTPKAMTQPLADQAGGAVAGACLDQITASHNGDPAALGFPIGYTTTIIGGDGKPSVVSMEVTEFEVTTLDQALFEIPQGLNAAINPRELSKALSDANEAKLVAADSAPAPAPVARTPGVVRIGVPEFTNKTEQTVDTRGLRSRLITELIVAKFEAVPMAAAPQPELQKRAAELGYDYLLTAEVAELKVSKPGALGGMLRTASRVASPTADAPKDITEASVAVKLIQADGKQRLSTTTKGKDGSAFTMQTGLGLARFAGTMYMSMMMGPAMMNQLNGLGGANLGGMGMLGSPDLFRMQTGGLGGAMASGMGVDGTAGAASYLIQQAMAMNSAGGLVGMPGAGPSYDASLGEALDGAVKAVTKSLQPK